MDKSGKPKPDQGARGKQEVLREKSRDSMFLTTTVVFDGSPQEVTARVRNISSGGMMIDMAASRDEGLGLTAQLKNVGEVRGTVAWSTDTRMGIAFEHEIDPQLARVKPVVPPTSGYKPPKTDPRRPGLAVR